MEANQSNGNGREQLRDENAFLKMKLMLEHGAQFSEQPSNDLPPEIENMFLQNVMAFEEQMKDQQPVKVFDVLGRPTHFLPAPDIADEDMHDAWNELQDYLKRHSIFLSACSPAVTERELYRFTTEELFDHEIMMMNLPGWNCNFIYDEFHPDPVYEATKNAISGMKSIFRKELLTESFCFLSEGLHLNLYTALKSETFLKIINRFKDSFDDIVLTSTSDVNCEVKENCALVKGKYRVKCLLSGERLVYRGDWQMSMVRDSDNWWVIKGLQVTGIEF